MEVALSRDDLDEWAKADTLFHERLVRHTGNKRLAEMAAIVADQAHRARMVTLHFRPQPTSSNDEHRAIIAAIVAGDPRTAARITRRHRMKGLKMVVDTLAEVFPEQ